MNEQVIDHEVRIRMLEIGINNINETLKETRTESINAMKNLTKELEENLKGMRQEIKSQFHWTLGLAFGFVSIVLLPVVCAEIISLIKTL